MVLSVCHRTFALETGGGCVWDFCVFSFAAPPEVEFGDLGVRGLGIGVLCLPSPPPRPAAGRLGLQPVPVCVVSGK